MGGEAGIRIGDYEILNELGSGGMARVYRVRNVISDRIEAMKVLLPDLAGRQELAARFLREIKLLATLSHPNIAALRTALTLENRLVMIMEYVEGTTLAARLERGPIPVPEAMNYIDQILGALSYAHRQHVIHRDIKPSNIMVTGQGVVKLMDFGIAHAGNDGGLSLTATGTTLGTVNYMPPEQVQGKAVDERSDLYSLGITFYEMVTGQKPFQADSDFSIMAAHVKETPRPPLELQAGIPPALNDIILMAIAKDPKERFQSADAFRNALSNVGRLPMAQAAAQGPGGTASKLGLHDAPTATLTSVAATTAPSAATTATFAAASPAPASTPAPPAERAGYRGFYMAAGALIVLVVLVTAGVYIPGRGKANERSVSARPEAPAVAAQQTPVAPPIPDSTVKPDTLADNPQADLEKQAELERRAELQKQAEVDRRKQLQRQAELQKQAELERQAEVERQRLLAESEQRLENLFSRAAAVNNSLERLQQQQAASGYGLRGDMAARQASMQTNLSKAQGAVERGDPARAKRYTDLAEADVDMLERFLGR